MFSLEVSLSLGDEQWQHKWSIGDGKSSLDSTPEDARHPPPRSIIRPPPANYATPDVSIRAKRASRIPKPPSGSEQSSIDMDRSFSSLSPHAQQLQQSVRHRQFEQYLGSVRSETAATSITTVAKPSRLGQRRDRESLRLLETAYRRLPRSGRAPVRRTRTDTSTNGDWQMISLLDSEGYCDGLDEPGFKSGLTPLAGRSTSGSPAFQSLHSVAWGPFHGGVNGQTDVDIATERTDAPHGHNHDCSSGSGLAASHAYTQQMQGSLENKLPEHMHSVHMLFERLQRQHDAPKQLGNREEEWQAFSTFEERHSLPSNAVERSEHELQLDDAGTARLCDSNLQSAENFLEIVKAQQAAIVGQERDIADGGIDDDNDDEWQFI
ncbi:hypothetical protein BAUCODRAFT_553150 [Baudoinia panamericana UAMH 10762]|uniref:Uncharacterized protein n=1 Tax=Baudoinia panamericana (strain UAMH 10762) TaxID=717646 RepID=M2MDI1_BAUPA|nr:uncharacterized protein BAUCODRAFT_553150 [Baudoinia panamericana UAMH 10762]EMC94586.1 hypothetical protein BAUCODRAFT_553150 [Baudoinia panamericana UAMH 10762]